MTNIENEHVTEVDAFVQLHLARLGAHVGATDTYLVALRGQLFCWIAEIDAVLAARIEKAKVRLENR